MAKISSYPSDANVTTSDRLIGSDNENSNETKNFVVGDIITLASSIILPQVAGSYVPYTGATANVDLGTYDLNADVVTTQIVNVGDIYANNLFNSGGNPSIFVGNDSITPVGLLINTSTNSFKLGDYNGDYNGTFIGIYDNLQQIQFKGGFYVGGGEGTVGNVLLSNGAGVTPSWSSTLNLLTITASNYFINSEMTINPSAALFIDGGLFVNGSAGTSGQVLTSQGIGLAPTWATLPSISGFVPYTGATTGVNLGIYSLTAANVNSNNFVPVLGGSGNTFFGGAGGYGVARNGVYALGTDITILGNSSLGGNKTKIEIDDINDLIRIGNSVSANIEIDSSGVNYISFNNTKVVIGSIDALQLANGNGTVGQVLTSQGASAPIWTTLPSFTGFVPYTGATGGVDLGIYSLTAANVNANNVVPVLGGSGNIYLGGAGGYGVAQNGVYCTQTGLVSDITILGNSLPGSGTKIQIDATNTSISFLNGNVNLGGTNGLVLLNGSGSTGEVLICSGASSAPLWSNAAQLATNTFWKGSFYDTITQTLTGGANVEVPVILRNTDATATNGVSIVTDGTNLTRITFANGGTYNILFSAQLANSAGTSQTVDFWLRKNGSTAAANIANTNGKVLLQGNANYLMAAWNYFVTVNAGDYIQLMWTATSTNITMVYEAATAVHPATPSVIVTVNLV